MPKQTKPAPASMADFNIATQSTEGVKVPLHKPDGTKTAEWIQVRGMDCLEFRKAQARIPRQRLQYLQKAKKGGKDPDPADLREQELKWDRELVASLVADWSFSEDCTPDNVVGFFEQAPQIKEQVESFAGERLNFFGAPSTS